MTGFQSKRAMAHDKLNGENEMSAVKDLFYDIESMFIEGYGAKAIATKLNVPLEEVNDVLDSFGVDAADVDAADWDELEADEYERGDYFGA